MDQQGYPPPVFNPPFQVLRPPVFLPPPPPVTWQPPLWNGGATPWWQPPWGMGAQQQQHSSWLQAWHHSSQPQGNHDQKWPNQQASTQWSPNTNQYDFRKHKKVKKEPVYMYHCDTCERGFKNQDKYNEHLSQHTQAHGPGAKAIQLDTPEEITKWREERKRNFPTLENIARKRKMCQDKMQRGEVLRTRQFDKMKGKWKSPHLRHRRSFCRKFEVEYEGHFGRPGGPQEEQNAREQARPTQPNRTCNKGAEKQEACGKDVDPLGILAQNDAESDKDEGQVDAEQAEIIVVPKQITSGLSSLMANYSSSSDSESDQRPEEIPISKAVEENRVLLESAPRSSNEQEIKGRAGRILNSESHNQFGPRGGRRGRGRGHDTQRRRTFQQPLIRRPTLLEMLLARDMRHERNVILQCVRYIIENKFLGLEQNGTAATPVPSCEGTAQAHTQTAECSEAHGLGIQAPELEAHTVDNPKAEEIGGGPTTSPANTKSVWAAEGPQTALPVVDDDIWELPQAMCEER
ncbi:FMR1-interacting protein NUFIP1 isoform X2 [Mustelus asterias]